jgi:isopentenyldiphosphate isomerase
MSDREIIARIKDGQFHSWIERGELDFYEYNYRCINIIIVNKEKQILLQKRSKYKKIQPLHWDISVAGHIPREDYPNQNGKRIDVARYTSAKREMLEELGISGHIKFVHETHPVNGIHNEYISFFTCMHEGPFELQRSEVDKVLFMPLNEIQNVQPHTKQLQWMLLNGIVSNLINPQ